MRPALLVLLIVASPGPAPQTTIGAEDCRALSLMEKLAQIAAWTGRDVVAAQAQLVCAQNASNDRETGRRRRAAA